MNHEGRTEVDLDEQKQALGGWLVGEKWSCEGSGREVGMVSSHTLAGCGKTRGPESTRLLLLSKFQASKAHALFL